MSGLEKLMGMVTTQTEGTEPGENLGGGMMYEVEKPSFGKVMSLFIWFKFRKKDKFVEIIGSNVCEK